MLHDLLLDRRAFFQLGTAGLALASLPGAAAIPGLALDNPAEHVRVYMKLNCSERPGDTTTLRYSGITYGGEQGTDLRPLYGMEGLIALKSFGIDQRGVGRLTFSEIGLFTDMVTGEVIEEWANPFLGGEVVPVWHLRNGPSALKIDPRAETGSGGFRAMRPPTSPIRGFNLPMYRFGDDLVVAIDTQARRPNPLDPAVWKRESTGPLLYSEHNNFRAKLSEIVSRDVPSPEIFGAWHSHKQWRPWMLMGQRPGYIYNHLLVNKIQSFDAVPRPVMAYAEKHLASFLDAPPQWNDGEYNTDWAYFAKSRRPR